MLRSFRPFSLAGLAGALVVWAGLATLFPPRTVPGPAPRDATYFEITGQVLEQYLGDPAAASRLAEAAPHHDEHGRIDGYRLSGFAPGSPPHRLGLREGDVVHELDEIDLLSELDWMRAWDAVRTRPSFCAHVTRAGRPLALCYEVDSPGVTAPRIEVDRDELAPYVADLDRVEELGHAYLHRDATGDYDGYRIGRVHRDSFLGRHGLKSGDIVHALDEIEVTSVQGAMDAWVALRHREEFCLRVSRRGSPLTLCYTVCDGR